MIDSKIDSEFDLDEELIKISGSLVFIWSIFYFRSRINFVKLLVFWGELDDKWKVYINRFEVVVKFNNWIEEDKLV